MITMGRKLPSYATFRGSSSNTSLTFMVTWHGLPLHWFFSVSYLFYYHDFLIYLLFLEYHLGLPFESLHLTMTKIIIPEPYHHSLRPAKWISNNFFSHLGLQPSYTLASAVYSSVCPFFSLKHQILTHPLRQNPVVMTPAGIFKKSYLFSLLCSYCICPQFWLFVF